MKLSSFLQKCKLCQNPQTSTVLLWIQKQDLHYFPRPRRPFNFLYAFKQATKTEKKLRIKKIEQEISATITATVFSCNQNTQPEEFKTAISLSTTFWALKP